jgi:putative tricarboxylic transport membrane protein
MDILSGFQTLISSPSLFGFIALGVGVGTIVGAMPGMSIAAVVALMVPITLFMDPLAALAFLYVLGKAGRYGGSIAAVLFNTPGTAAASATMLDGYPLTQQGRSRSALKMSATASATGDFIGDMFLIFGAIFIAQFTENLGPPEFFSIYLMAFVIIGSVVSDSVSKGLISAVLGILISLVGTDPISGKSRMTFDVLELERGFGLIPLLVGVFVISELFVQAQKLLSKSPDAENPKNVPVGDKKDFITAEEWRICRPVILRSSLLGSLIGALPGLGSAVACFAAYGEESRRAKRKELWGKGAIEGVAAPEAANNAVSGPSMIPLLTLGVPGSTIAALLMGVFMIHGIQVGPLIFSSSRELIFALFASGLLGILGYWLVGFYLSPILGHYIARVNGKYLYPFIFVTSFIAAYAAATNFFDVYVMVVFGIFGYLLRQFSFSTSAFIIAFVLGRGAEETLRQSALLSDSGLLIFFERPVALAFMGLGLLVVFSRLYISKRSQRRSAVKSSGEVVE